MYRPFALFAGMRYLRAKRRNRFLSFISSISIIGICLGVVALITIISIMNGFQAELRNRLLGMASHMVVTTDYGQTFNINKTEEILLNYEQVKALAPFVEGDAMLSNGKSVIPVLVRGVKVDAEKSVSHILDYITLGAVSEEGIGRGDIVLGIELADSLSITVGDSVSVIVPITKEDSASIIPRIKKFKVSAIFQADVHQYDSVLAIINLPEARSFFRDTGAEVGERVLLHNMDDAPALKELLAEKLNYRIRDWTDVHATFFAAIKIEKVVMFAILLLIIMVAAFNIVSTLAMGVAEKQSDIAILKTMGASQRMILKIFMIQGATIGFIGTSLGAVFGVIVASNVAKWISVIEKIVGSKLFPPNVFYISEIPSVMYWSDVIFVVCFSLLISFVATLYPSWRASKILPAQALKYE